MAQKFQRFRARTFDEAYRQMRQTLGGEAVVIRTTEVADAGLRGLLGRKMVELTASAPETRPAPRKKSLAESRYAASRVGSSETVENTVAYFQQLVSDAQQRMSRPPARPQPAVPRVRQSGAAAVAPVIPFERQAPKTDVEALKDQMAAIQEQLAVLVAEAPAGGMPSEVAPQYARLLRLGFSRKAAAALLAAAVRESDLNVLRNERVLTERLKMEIQRGLGVTGGIELNPGTRRTVALVGPTGVGKTTNLAKLAARYSVREGVRVGLITADTYRVAAPEQLRVYANIIGLPMEVVNDRHEMEAAMHRFRDHDLVLVDTAGSSQFNLAQLNELRATLEAARADEVMLVAASNTQLDDLREVAANFSALRATSLLVTKLDETRHYGAVYCLANETGLPISYLSVGQEVPDDLALATPGMVAGLIMEGKESRG